MMSPDKVTFSIKCIILIGVFQLVGGDIITSPPVDSATCYGGIATFHCGSDRGSDIGKVEWIINNEEDLNQLDNNELVMRGLSNQTIITDDYAASNLTIVGLPVNDGVVVIQCKMITKSFDIDTALAIFTVTDIPPVTDLSIEFTGTIMNITWDAPSVLPVDHHYLINITNGNVTISNTTVDPVYTMSISSCSSNYTVSVSVVDIGYTQLHSVPVDRTEQSNEVLSISLFQGSVSVMFVDRDICWISVAFEIPKLCPEQHYDLFIETVQSILPPDAIHYERTVDILHNFTYYGNYSFGPFVNRFIGNITVIPKNNLNTNGSTIKISTFHVQNFSLSVLPNDATVELTCFFAFNSSADGCNVTYNSTQSVLEAIFITKNKDETKAVMNYTGIPEGIHAFSIYDVVDGVSNLSVAAVNGLEYTIQYNIPSTTYTLTMETSVSSSSVFVFASSTVDATTTAAPITSSQAATVSPDIKNFSTNTINVAVVITIIIVPVILVVMIIIVSIILFLVLYKKNKQKNLRRLNKELALVRLPAAEIHEYTEFIPHLTNHDDDDIYHESLTDFLQDAVPVNEDHKTTSLMNIKTRNDPPLHENAWTHISSPVTQSSTTTSPSTATPTNHVPAGPKLDVCQYAEIKATTGGTSRPIPRLPEPKTEYATVVATKGGPPLIYENTAQIIKSESSATSHSDTGPPKSEYDREVTAPGCTLVLEDDNKGGPPLIYENAAQIIKSESSATSHSDTGPPKSEHDREVTAPGCTLVLEDDNKYELTPPCYENENALIVIGSSVSQSLTDTSPPATPTNHIPAGPKLNSSQYCEVGFDRESTGDIPIPRLTEPKLEYSKVVTTEGHLKSSKTIFAPQILISSNNDDHESFEHTPIVGLNHNSANDFALPNDEPAVDQDPTDPTFVSDSSNNRTNDRTLTTDDSESALIHHDES